MIVKKENISLKPYNTFGIDVHADGLFVIESVSDLRTVLQDESLKMKKKLILGGGSNMLFTRDVQGVVLLNRIKGIEIFKEDEENFFVKAGAGEVWHEFVMWSVEKGYGGIENLSLIPGSVGAGPMQNIGAYGVELKDSFYELEAMNLVTLEIQKFSAADCKFGYRESVFKHEFKNMYFITSVSFRLSKRPTTNISYGAITQELEKLGVASPTVKDVSRAVINIRQSKLPDPKVLGNSGSFFKNPEISKEQYDTVKQNYPNVVAYPTASGNMKLAAGWLIEQCGWKGKVVGKTGSHKDQALVLVNYGGATGSEVYQLALEIRKSVLEKFGVVIDPEVNVY
jgi:UDP-N-acetylmuramate dehydrogenase